MNRRYYALKVLPACAALCLATAAPAPAGLLQSANVQPSIVKVYATIQYHDYSMPWQAMNPFDVTGSGFVIEKKRILTNAHVVSDARYLEVEREGDPRRYPAKVLFVGHDCDLAVIEPSDPAFFNGTTPLEIGDVLPALNDEVTVWGYPMGGTRISITKGVISRIDYSQYSHSGVDAHLVLQVDAAINPGNSGGPVLYKGKVVGMAFQVLTAGQNIGYAIPIPVLKHFLLDIADGVYNGYPELGVTHIDLRSPAMRADLHLTEKRTGVVIAHVDPFGAAIGHLMPRDVLLTIDDHAIANDGTILVGDNPVDYLELLERKQWGDSVRFTVWRSAAEMTITVPLTNPVDPFTFRNLYDRKPEYYMVGGLVFSPLTSDYLRTLGGSADPDVQNLAYYSLYAKMDGQYKDRDQFVVLISRLAHRVNTYDESYMNGIVSEVNGHHIRSLNDMKQAIAQNHERFIVIRFEGNENPLVLGADAAAKANQQVLSEYGVVSPEHFEVSP